MVLFDVSWLSRPSGLSLHALSVVLVELLSGSGVASQGDQTSPATTRETFEIFTDLTSNFLSSGCPSPPILFNGGTLWTPYGRKFLTAPLLAGRACWRAVE